jgi:hypothetical protein
MKRILIVIQKRIPVKDHKMDAAVVQVSKPV